LLWLIDKNKCPCGQNHFVINIYYFKKKTLKLDLRQKWTATLTFNLSI
jgi:hypothetical protein